MTEHTPTPWRTSEPEDSNYALEIVATNARGKEELVCRPPGKRRDANAAFIVKAVNSHHDLIEALRPFAWYFDVNDCKDRREDDALEVPIRDLRIAFELFEALGIEVKPIPDAVGREREPQ